MASRRYDRLSAASRSKSSSSRSAATTVRGGCTPSAATPGSLLARDRSRRELAVAIGLSALVRRWIGYRVWRALHALTYCLFPLSLLHTLGTGTDTQTLWATLLYGGSFVAVTGALLWRAPAGGEARQWVLVGSVVVWAMLVVWGLNGPYAPHWAAVSGTPPALLQASSPPQATAASADAAVAGGDAVSE